ncbi:MAG: hypothetical protein R3336_00765, partial [Phycisphaeraceae bacterium]|nr:hypothetical protein [Phycisphaeraceae bacterium]
MIDISRPAARFFVFLAVTLAMAVPFTASAQEQGELAQLAERVRESTSATAADAKTLMEQAEAAGEPLLAHLAIKAYLKRQSSPDPDLLLAAAANAQLAGDVRTAVSRYKTYLAEVESSPQASRVAGRLYRLLVGTVKAHDDAYQFMKRRGHDLRQDASARQFDSWFLDQARRRKDPAALAERLAAMADDGLSRARWQWLADDHVAWLFDRLTAADEQAIAALPSLRRIAAGSALSGKRKARANLLMAHLTFHAESGGKNESELNRAFTAVTDAAKSYLQGEPTARGMGHVFALFAGDASRFNHGHWKKQAQAKQAFFAEAFGWLKDDDQRKSVLGLHHGGQRWVQHAVAESDWLKLAAKFPAAFADAGTSGHIPFDQRASKLADYRGAAAALKNVPGERAAVVRAVAAGGADYGAVAERLLTGESWSLSYDRAWHLVSRELPHVINALETGEMPGHDQQRAAWAELGRKVIAPTEMALFEPGAAGQSLEAAWHVADDKSDIVKDLQALAWVPWTEEQRKQAINPAYTQFKRWTESLRRNQEAAKDQLNKVSKIEAAFTAALKTAGDPAAAGGDRARLAATAITAIRDGDVSAYETAARAIYQAVRDYDERKTAFGEVRLKFALGNHGDDFQTVDMQAELLADQLATWPAGNDRSIRVAFGAVEPHGGWHRVPKDQRDRSRQINRVLEQALVKQMESGRFWPVAY